MTFGCCSCFRLAWRHTHTEATGGQREAEAPVHGQRLMSLRETECESLHQAGEHQEELHLGQLFSHAHPPTCRHEDHTSPYRRDKTQTESKNGILLMVFK